MYKLFSFIRKGRCRKKINCEISKFCEDFKGVMEVQIEVENCRVRKVKTMVKKQAMGNNRKTNNLYKN